MAVYYGGFTAQIIPGTGFLPGCIDPALFLKRTDPEQFVAQHIKELTGFIASPLETIATTNDER